MQGLGYKELFGYLEGEYPLEEAVRIIQRDTRHFAKRQLTWFRRERDVIWIDKSIVGRDEDEADHIYAGSAQRKRDNQVKEEDKKMGIMDTEKIYEGLGISREVWEYGQKTEEPAERTV